MNLTCICRSEKTFCMFVFSCICSVMCMCSHGFGSTCVSVCMWRPKLLGVFFENALSYSLKQNLSVKPRAPIVCLVFQSSPELTCGMSSLSVKPACSKDSSVSISQLQSQAGCHTHLTLNLEYVVVTLILFLHGKCFNYCTISSA